MTQNLMTRFLKETIPSGGEKPWPLDVPLNKPGSTKAPGTCRLWSRALGWRSCVAGLRQLGWALIESSGWDMILDMILGCLGHGFWDMLGYRVEWFLLGFWMRDKPRFFLRNGHVFFCIRVVFHSIQLTWPWKVRGGWTTIFLFVQSILRVHNVECPFGTASNLIRNPEARLWSCEVLLDIDGYWTILDRPPILQKLGNSWSTSPNLDRNKPPYKTTFFSSLNPAVFIRSQQFWFDPCCRWVHRSAKLGLFEGLTRFFWIGRRVCQSIYIYYMLYTYYIHTIQIRWYIYI